MGRGGRWLTGSGGVDEENPAIDPSFPPELAVVVRADFGREFRRIPVATPIWDSCLSLLLDFAARTLLRVRGV